MFYFLLLCKLFIGFIITILHLNFSGKTQISQMNAIDLIGNFILGGIIGGVIYSDSISFQTYILALLTGIFLINAVNWGVKRTPLLRAFTVGDPILLILDGKLQVETLKKEKAKVDINVIMATLRTMGYTSLSEINYLQIESNGQLTVQAKEDNKAVPAIVLFSHGVIDTNALKKVGKEEEWFLTELDRIGVGESLEDVFLIEFQQGSFYVVYNNGEWKVA